MKLLSYKFFLVLIYLISTVISFADETDIKNLLIHKQNKKLENVTFTDVNDKIINPARGYARLRGCGPDTLVTRP